MNITIAGLNIKSKCKKETISVKGNSIQEMLTEAYNNGYEVNKLDLLQKMFQENDIILNEDNNIVLDNSQFVYFGSINEVLKVLKNISKQRKNIDPDNLCDLLDKYDRQYQK